VDVYNNLKRLGIEIPECPAKGGRYVSVKQVGNLLFTSGHGPILNGQVVSTGKVGAERTIEEGRESARACVLNILAVVQEHIGDLNKVKNVVKLLGFVASAPDFNQQPKVIDAGSELLGEVFGEAGSHARSALGANELPGNITVEIEAIFEV
jgi:enamine deaminase RidA (YjgF/YER057c/UK114 family)